MSAKSSTLVLSYISQSVLNHVRHHCYEITPIRPASRGSPLFDAASGLFPYFGPRHTYTLARRKPYTPPRKFHERVLLLQPFRNLFYRHSRFWASALFVALGASMRSWGAGAGKASYYLKPWMQCARGPYEGDVKECILSKNNIY